MNRPDHNTLNRFRSERLKGELKDIFAQIVLYLENEGLVSLHTIFTDGTKIEANANRYSFVWGKSIKNNKERIESQLEELWNYTQQVAKEEMKDTSEIVFKSMDKEKIKSVIETIDHTLKNKKIPSKTRQKINYAKKNWPDNLEKYEKQQEILKSRNSYSKTDPDASFMRMKEDHMRNGQLKAAYNLQLSTENQFIINYTLHPNPGDTKTLLPHIENFEHLYNKRPKEIVADAGYGSEENYIFLQKRKIKAYIKYNYFDKDQKNKTITSSSSNPKLSKLRHKVHQLLNTKRGVKLRKQRCHDVEPVFAQIKHNKGFKRFFLRGQNKVEIETGLIAIAHNLRKLALAG
ncbi:hypothetical protein PMI06_010054 [Burkholderia sp. BT03]|nr:hypothetical protein PMI06_010054 [Burkholderia sp. BT03]